jgi:hypothetical protein
MRAVAWVGGLAIVGALIFLAVAGFSGALPILISAVALVAMIGLGGAMGGRHTPNVAPMATGPEAVGPPMVASQAAANPTADPVPPASASAAATGGPVGAADDGDDAAAPT